jgi:serine/threonine protein kinase
MRVSECFVFRVRTYVDSEMCMNQQTAVIAIVTIGRPEALTAGTNSPEEKYKWIRKLGSGGFGVVDLVQRSDNNELFARKWVNIYNLSMQDLVRLEANVLYELRNEHIVSLVEFYEQWLL